MTVAHDKFFDGAEPAQLRAVSHGRRGWSVLSAASLGIAACMIVPMLALAFYATTPGDGIWRHLADTVLADYVANTAALVFFVGIGTALLGTGAAWLVVMYRFPGRAVLEWALILPLAAPAYVLAYAYTDLLQTSGPVQTWFRDFTGLAVRDYWFPPIRSLGGAAAIFTLVLYPYVYLLARASFLAQGAYVVEASRMLGARPWTSFRRVVLPLARPAIAAGVALALMETLADYGTVSYFGVPTFTTGIVRAWASLQSPSAAAQLSLALLAFVVLVVALERSARGARRFHNAASKVRCVPETNLAGWRGALAAAACALPVALGFLVPALALVSLWAETGLHLDRRYVDLVWHSALLAGLAAVLAVLAAMIVSAAVRASRARPMQWVAAAAGYGYALPGAIIAVGVLLPFGALDRFVDGVARASFGISTGLLLTGTIAGLVFAYLVRFFAVARQSVEAAFDKVTPSMGAAARLLGANETRTLWRVQAPLISGGVLTAALIVFVDVLKELPATLILRPFNFDTLAVQAYAYASDERLAQAAAPALTIVLVGLVPLIVLSRQISRTARGRGAAADAPPILP
jgi:iron(III) transport system permease protein